MWTDVSRITDLKVQLAPQLSFIVNYSFAFEFGFNVCLKNVFSSDGPRGEAGLLLDEQRRPALWSQ